MMTLPVRSTPLLGATVKLTVPLPLLLTGGTSVIQLTSVVAVHAQSLLTETDTLPEPPPAPTLWFEGATSYRQGARCDTRMWLSLMTISPSRADDPSLAATRKDTSPVPCPDVGVIAEIQFAEVDAFQAHSGCVVTFTVPEPPDASTIEGVVTSN